MRKKFAFLIHPRNSISADMADLFGSPLRVVPNGVWTTLFRSLPIPPQITGRLTYPDAPDEVAGTIITVPFTPRQLLDLPRRKVQARIADAVDMARDGGAEIVGLGALTAPATAGGKWLAKRDDIGVTNGNAFTAAMTLMGIERLLLRLGPDPLIAFVGATGSVGSCLVSLFARKHGGRVLLVARNEVRLDRLAGEVRSSSLSVETSTDMGSVRDADLVVLLTSAADAILGSEHLKHGAIILDDTVPRNTDKNLLKLRPDITIVDGGLVELHGATLKGAIGLPPGLVYACLAETMLLGLEGHEGHFSVGTPKVEQAEFMLKAAQRHRSVGFGLAPFRSFGALIDPEVDGEVPCAA